MPNAALIRHRLKQRWQDRLRKIGLVLINKGKLSALRERLRAAEDVIQADRERLRNYENELAEARQLRERLAALEGLAFPVYVAPPARPAAQPAAGSSPHRAVVCSIPKAGTYLVAALLHRFGCEPTNLHLCRHKLSDYRRATLREMREEHERFTVSLGLPEALDLLLPGQFAVGHLECTPDTVACLSAFKTLFVYRDLRDALVSFVRFIGDTGRGGAATQTWRHLADGPDKMLLALEQVGRDFFGMAAPMGDWLARPEVLPVAFETLYGDGGAAAQRRTVEAVHAFLEIPGTIGDVPALVRGLIGAPTKTWSGRRTVRDIFWNDTVEERFRTFGGPALNARLGYS